MDLAKKEVLPETSCTCTFIQVHCDKTGAENCLQTYLKHLASFKQVRYNPLIDFKKIFFYG